LITEPGSGKECAQRLILEFEAQLAVFHGQQDMTAGWYYAVNRKGEREQFPLLALSIGIITTVECRVESYAQLASLATEVKKAAKGHPGSSIIVNRRTSGFPLHKHTQKETAYVHTA